MALLAGCAQQVIAPSINDATIRLLTRMGVEVVVAQGAGCCGALTQHMGRHADAMSAARANIQAWSREIDGAGPHASGLDAPGNNLRHHQHLYGCGMELVKDYGFLFRNDPLREAAERIATLTLDISEFLTPDRLPRRRVRHPA